MAGCAREKGVWPYSWLIGKSRYPQMAASPSNGPLPVMTTKPGGGGHGNASGSGTLTGVADAVAVGDGVTDGGALGAAGILVGTSLEGIASGGAVASAGATVPGTA